MVALPHMVYFMSVLVWIAYLHNIASQNLEDWEFSLAHLSDDLIQLSHPSMSRWRLQDEEEPSKRHVQPRSNVDPDNFH